MKRVSDSMKSKKARGVCIGVAAVAIVVLAVSFASCSTAKPESDASSEGAMTNPAAQEADRDVDAETPTEEDGVSKVEASVGSSGEPAPEAASDSQGFTAQTEDSILLSGASIQAETERPTPPQSQKKWVEDTERVWVENKGAWSEQVPNYGTKEVSICNVCGADVTGSTSSHGKAHMLAGEGSGHHSEVRQVVTGYNTVNHAAEGHWETKVVGGHWE